MNQRELMTPNGKEEGRTTPQRETTSTGTKGGGPPLTSLEAFHSVEEADKESIRRAILTEVIKNGPDTSIHLAHRIKLPEDSVWKRCSELLQAGLLVRQGRKVNPSGREASLLIAGPNAAEWLGGFYDIKALTPITVKERLARIVKAARDVSREGKAKEGSVVVPMDLMVALHVAIQRYDDEVKRLG